VVGVNLVVPIFAGGATQSKVREAAALEQQARDNLLAARRAAALAAQQSYNGVQSGLAQVRALEAAEKSSRLALDSNKLGYKVGVRINIDVLNAQQQVFTTRRDLLKARYDTLINSLNLKAAAANLGEQDIQQLNQLLESVGASGAAAPATAPTAAPTPRAAIPITAPSMKSSSTDSNTAKNAANTARLSSTEANQAERTQTLRYMLPAPASAPLKLSSTLNQGT
jgi:outer membrane protein